MLDVTKINAQNAATLAGKPAVAVLSTKDAAGRAAAAYLAARTAPVSK